jgi:hypothetical protein
MHITNKKKNGGAHTTFSSLPFKKFCQPKISQFWGVILIQKAILWFDVKMDNDWITFM